MSLLSTLRQAVQRNRNDASEAQLDPETAYTILRNHRRRCVLQYVATQSETPVPVGDIADHLAASHGEDRTAAYVALIQSHLPMMDDAEICRYEENRKTVELTARGWAVIKVHQTVLKLLD